MGEALLEVLAEGARAVAVRRHAGATSGETGDRVAHEEPLEIRLGNETLALLMRTPGHDRELVAGLLISERIVDSPVQVESIHHCSEAPSGPAEDNVVRATLRPGVTVDLERLRRNLVASTSCGLCGKTHVEAALAVAPPLDDPARFPAELFYGLPERLRAAQPVFRETGGLHAAALFDAAGTLLVTREDVGRHNAVDKVIGWAAREGRLPLSGHGLLVSGRISFEIVQKALAARLPVVAAVSAPSSLAVSLAEASNVALVGFLRGRALNVYGARERILPAQTAAPLSGTAIDSGHG